jgi:hypothetical protein
LQAFRFRLDAEASTFFGEIVHSYGRQVVSQHQLARAPYDLCWVEFECGPYANAVPVQRDTDDPSDTKAGFFYDHGKVSIASTTEVPKSADFLPYYVVLHRPSTAQEEEANAEFFRLTVSDFRRCMFGDIGGLRPNEVLSDAFWMSPEFEAIVRSHSFVVDPAFARMVEQTHVNTADRRRMLIGAIGVFKQIVVLLLLMTRPNKHVFFRETEVPARRAFLGNRQVPFVRHNVITMHLEQKEAVRQAMHEPSGRHNKHHDVKGHWCESRKKGRGCQHLWTMLDEDHGECSYGCGAKKWWKAKHTRGDIHLGSTSKTYAVTK